MMSFEWLTSVATIITPFAVLWLGILAGNRRKVMDAMRKEIEEGRKECREDIQALIRQLSEYPRRDEVQDSVKEIRQELWDQRRQR